MVVAGVGEDGGHLPLWMPDVDLPVSVLVRHRAVGESWNKPIREGPIEADNIAVEPKLMRRRISCLAKRDRRRLGSFRPSGLAGAYPSQRLPQIPAAT